MIFQFVLANTFTDMMEKNLKVFTFHISYKFPKNSQSIHPMK